MSVTEINVDPGIPAALVLLTMLIGWSLGWWRGRAFRGREGPSGGKMGDAIMALLGLLLAFTFSMSLVKHEQRRQMAVADSNAIGDFSTCLSLLEEPIRGKSQVLLRQYVEHRLSIASPTTDEDDVEQALIEIQEMHAQMQGLVKEAVDGGTPIVVPLVNTFNAVTSNHAARLAAVRDKLPLSILLLLALAAVISMAIVGMQQSMARELNPGATLGFAVLVSLVIWIILDLNQPQQGWIRVSQEPLERLLNSFPE